MAEAAKPALQRLLLLMSPCYTDLLEPAGLGTGSIICTTQHVLDICDQPFILQRPSTEQIIIIVQQLDASTMCAALNHIYNFDIVLAMIRRYQPMARIAVAWATPCYGHYNSHAYDEFDVDPNAYKEAMIALADKYNLVSTFLTIQTYCKLCPVITAGPRQRSKFTAQLKALVTRASTAALQKYIRAESGPVLFDYRNKGVGELPSLEDRIYTIILRKGTAKARPTVVDVAVGTSLKSRVSTDPVPSVPALATINDSNSWRKSAQLSPKTVAFRLAQANLIIELQQAATATCGFGNISLIDYFEVSTHVHLADKMSKIIQTNHPGLAQELKLVEQRKQSGHLTSTRSSRLMKFRMVAALQKDIPGLQLSDTFKGHVYILARKQTLITKLCGYAQHSILEHDDLSRKYGDEVRGYLEERYKYVYDEIMEVEAVRTLQQRKVSNSDLFRIHLQLNEPFTEHEYTFLCDVEHLRQTKDAHWLRLYDAFVGERSLNIFHDLFMQPVNLLPLLYEAVEQAEWEIPEGTRAAVGSHMSRIIVLQRKLIQAGKCLSSIIDLFLVSTRPNWYQAVKEELRVTEPLLWRQIKEFESNKQSSIKQLSLSGVRLKEVLYTDLKRNHAGFDFDFNFIRQVQRFAYHQVVLMKKYGYAQRSALTTAEFVSSYQEEALVCLSELAPFIRAEQEHLSETVGFEKSNISADELDWLTEQTPPMDPDTHTKEFLSTARELEQGKSVEWIRRFHPKGGVERHQYYSNTYAHLFAEVRWPNVTRPAPVLVFRDHEVGLVVRVPPHAPASNIMYKMLEDNPDTEELSEDARTSLSYLNWTD